MLSKQIKSRYSCRRKRDVVTFFAMFMFLLLVLFQLFLIFGMPVVIKREDTLAKHVEKEKMLREIDTLRSKVQRFKPPQKLARGEVQLVTGILDSFALHVRNNRDTMELPEITKVRSIFHLYHSVFSRWTATPAVYYIVPEKLDVSPAIQHMERELVY